MLKIGLTGGIGSGKTTVSDLFGKLGIPIIDTDIIAHELVTNKKILNELTDAFGKTILNENGLLNRKKLSQLVFNKKKDKQKLEHILHPKILSAVSKKIHELNTSDPVPKYLVIVIPLLIETDIKINFNPIIDRILVVMSDKTDRVKRIEKRDNRRKGEIIAIIATQTTDLQRIDTADDIIENNSNIKELDLQVQRLHKKYLTLADSSK